MNPVSECALWCLRGEKVIPFVAAVGAPHRFEDIWECEWSMGALLPHKLMPARSVNSMLAMISAHKSVVGFLKARCDVGDVFYMNEELTEKVDNVVELFWSSYFPHPDECKPK
jgi:hypothetical protein